MEVIEDNNSKKCIVIQQGTNTTIAGFNNSDLPQCVIPSTYIYDKQEDKMIFGLYDMLDIATSLEDADRYEVFTILDKNGIPYNWEALEQQWNYLFNDVLRCSPEEYPLVITIPSMKKEIDGEVLEKYFSLVFERFKFPVFQIILEPLAITLSLGKSSGLVIDMGSSGCRVTPIIDGTVIKNAVLSSKYGGAFLDYQIIETLQKKLDEEATAVVKGSADDDNNNVNIGTSQIDLRKNTSIEAWLQSNTWIKEFKSTMLQVTDKPLQDVEKHHKEQTEMYIRQHEEIQRYNSTVKDSSNANAIEAAAAANKTAIESIYNNNPLNQKKNYLIKPSHKTISLEARECYKLAEYLFQPNLASETFPLEDGLGGIIGKSIKKAAATVSSIGTTVSTTDTMGGKGHNMGPSLVSLHKNNNTTGKKDSNNGRVSASFITQSTSSSLASTINALKPEQVYAKLLTNVIITGSSSLLEGMEQRILKELSIRFPQYKLTTFANQNIMDRKFQSWLGTVTMSNLPSWELGKWYSKEEYEIELEKGKKAQKQNEKENDAAANAADADNMDIDKEGEIQ
ncbi:Arp7p NDAI_0A01300 [Naumovozyma dairenensis CBS 421]|uniref:Actin-related protein 7 n=1 Tax=Naumovozyma dairenensis (strain ATCC 10597 / BCRC 20456 / CBS 421 / NBRC 0211 / NRRL Y-12639) TaxID=1071378 RepID=G0W3A0_NAUDC|nr:hypothetical protein NDAI_0A01300 [Naumovozyma dairenensis CBS 421]CCD22288.1 hypothetical protein NDAI_0A01300 [Naumovozyma dairenensis CBS 421]